MMVQIQLVDGHPREICARTSVTISSSASYPPTSAGTVSRKTPASVRSRKLSGCIRRSFSVSAARARNTGTNSLTRLSTFSARCGSVVVNGLIELVDTDGASL